MAKECGLVFQYEDGERQACCFQDGHTGDHCWHAHKHAPATKEQINHPRHYGGDTTYEAIKVIEAWGLGFCLGNAVKYICRAGKKSEIEPLVDLKKARWYLDREINSREKQQ